VTFATFACALAVLVEPLAAVSDATRAVTANGIGLRVLETTTDLSKRLSRMPDVTFHRGVPKRMWVIHVDDTVRYQRLIGVGAAMTDSSAWLIWTKLRPAARDQLMRNLFSQSGDHLTFLRVPMAASDFTVGGRPYTYDDMPPGNTDPQLKRFSVDHDDAYIVPAIRRAMSLNPSLDVLANPWSPPGWMKANDTFDNAKFKGLLLPKAYGPLAQYFVKFLRAYARRGIDIDAVTPQNEPGSPATWPGMNLPEPREEQFILNNLVPSLGRAGLKTKIYGADSGFNNTQYPKKLASGPAREAIDGIAQHCYHGTPKQFSKIHDIDRTLDLVVSECAQELTPWSVPEIAIGSFRNWATAVALWNLALNPRGGPVQPPDTGCLPCRGLTVVNPASGTVQYSLGYYQLGQIGRWLQRGAQRIQSGHFVDYFEQSSKVFGTTSGLDDVAFRNPNGSIVLVAYNNSAHTVRFAIAWRGSSVTYRLPPGATASFVWQPRGT
jgi:glucosylceramidase